MLDNNFTPIHELVNEGVMCISLRLDYYIEFIITGWLVLEFYRGTPVIE